jgi:succinate dehydrogenase / fumarate reductase cytochrome b subunit
MQRPISPHLQVYRLPLTAILSISHRITGTLLVVGLMFYVGLLTTAVLGADYFTALQKTVATIPGQTLLWIWIYALLFHACHGIRHILWDSIRGFSRDQLFRHNMIELALSVGLTVALFLLTHGSSSALSWVGL